MANFISRHLIDDLSRPNQIQTGLKLVKMFLAKYICSFDKVQQNLRTRKSCFVTSSDALKFKRTFT